jgi:hypothetical protein
MIDREQDGSVYSGSPLCSCGSRNQQHIRHSEWFCLSCRSIHVYRVTSDGYVPLTPETAQALDEQRKV